MACGACWSEVVPGLYLMTGECWPTLIVSKAHTYRCGPVTPLTEVVGQWQHAAGRLWLLAVTVVVVAEERNDVAVCSRMSVYVPECGCISLGTYPTRHIICLWLL